MTPVAIGDTQGTLQARKMCKTVYNCPETLLETTFVHKGNLRNYPIACLHLCFIIQSLMQSAWDNYLKKKTKKSSTWEEYLQAKTASKMPCHRNRPPKSEQRESAADNFKEEEVDDQASAHPCEQVSC